MKKRASEEAEIQSVENCFTIINSIRELDGSGGVTEIADQIDISKGSVHKHLATLRSLGYIIKDGDKYRISTKFLDIGSQARDHVKGSNFIKRKIREIAIQTNEIAFFHIEENGKSVILFREVGHDGLPTRSRVGMRLYLHQVAAGKAILSEYPDHRIKEIIERHGIPAATEATIVDIDDLLDDLAQTRELGYATSVNEATEGLLAVGVPVTLPNGEVLGACSVGGPVHRMKNKKYNEDIVNILYSVANEIKMKVAYS